MATARLVVVTTAAGLLTSILAARVGEAPPLAIPWYLIDGGGGYSTGGGFTLDGTVGQPDAVVLSGGSFQLAGGFWAHLTTRHAAGDCNGDGIVVLLDYTCFADCMRGPEASTPQNCALFDFNDNGTVDLEDYGGFSTAFGSN